MPVYYFISSSARTSRKPGIRENWGTLRCMYAGADPSLRRISSKKSRWHDYVIKWKHFPRYWPFVRGIHRSPVNSPHKGQWRGALIFSLICIWINDWVNNREAGDLWRYPAHYDVSVMGSSQSRKNGRHFANDNFECISSMKKLESRLIVHWSLFLRVT